MRQVGTAPKQYKLTVQMISWFPHMVLPSLKALVARSSIFIVICVGKDGRWMLWNEEAEAEQFYEYNV